MGDLERRAVGKTLLLIGLVTTIPLALEIFHPRTKEPPSFGMQLV
jgi:hypothetical protein